MQALDCDFFVFSGHKVFGPTGIGVLYGKRGRCSRPTPPWQGGGNMIADVTFENDRLPGAARRVRGRHRQHRRCRRARRGARYVERVGIERIAAHEHELLVYGTPRLPTFPGVRLVGTADEKAGVLSFVLAGHEPLEVGKALDAEGIAVRAGHHCAQPILRRFGLEATVRPSLALYNTFDDIDVFIRAVRRIAEGSGNTG